MDGELLLRYVLKTLALPPAAPLLLAVLGLCLWRRAPRTGRAFAWSGVLVLLVLSVPAMSDLLVAAVERYPPLSPAQLAGAEAIVVLGGCVRRGPPGGAAAVLRPESLARLAFGARLARATGLPLLLSGGSIEGLPAEALVMRWSLEREFGLQPRWLDSRSRTTRENARESAALLAMDRMRRVVLVTSAVHLRRAVAEFEAAGLAVVPAPVNAGAPSYDRVRDWLPEMAALARSQAALYEIAGELVARLDRGG